MRSLLHKLPPPIRDWLRGAKYLEGAVRGVLRRLPLHQLPLCGWRSPRPSGLHWWVSEYVDCDVAARGDRIHTVFPAESIRRTLPMTAGNPLPEVFEQYRTAELAPATVCELHDVRFWGSDSGCIIAPDNRLIGDLSPDTWAPDRHRALARPWLPKVRELPGVVAVMTTTGEQNYWHWMAETLPRYHVLARAGFMPARVDWYLTSAKGTAFQRETWAALGIPEKKIVHVDAASHFTLQTALVPNHRLATWNVSRWLVEFLRSLPLREVAAPVRADRIYLSRASESHRRLACEAELVPLLEQRGFVAVECGKLSVAEQKAVFAQAQVVVAPHGAALTNLVFCQPDALVVDLMSAAWPGLFFWGLADACGLRYVCLADAPAARPGAVPDLRRDIEFSPAELLLRLDELLAAVHSLTPPAVSGRPS